MSEQYRLVFASLDEGLEQTEVAHALHQKLKLSPKQAQAFFTGRSIFAPSDKAKALKQAKVLASLGIRTRLQSMQSTANETANTASAAARDEQILAALDYITSSLIRLEERLDDMDNRLNDQLQQNSSNEVNDDFAVDLSLDEELELAPQPSRKRWPLFTLIALIVLLLGVLALAFIYPELLTF